MQHDTNILWIWLQIRCNHQRTEKQNSWQDLAGEGGQEDVLDQELSALVYSYSDHPHSLLEIFKIWSLAIAVGNFKTNSQLPTQMHKRTWNKEKKNDNKR